MGSAVNLALRAVSRFAENMGFARKPVNEKA